MFGPESRSACGKIGNEGAYSSVFEAFLVSYIFVDYQRLNPGNGFRFLFSFLYTGF